jgi:enterochelin esterase-like enzyme
MGLLDVGALILTVRDRRSRIRLGLPGRAMRTLGGTALVTVLTLAGGAAGINRHFDLYRSWGELLGPHSHDLVSAGSPGSLARATAVRGPGEAVPRHGTLLRLTIPATTSHLHVMQAYVYLPPQYRSVAYAHVAFPVVEAFNGSPGRPADWINGIRADAQLDTAIDHRLVAPAIVVFPPTNTGFLRSLECADTKDGLRDETYLTTDVRRWAVTHLRTARRRWTVIGYSTGGYCALDLALRHPDEFDRAISLDGYGRALQDHYARGLWRDRSDRLAHSPDWWMQDHKPEPVAIYLSAGTHDHDAAKDALRTWNALTSSGWRSSTDRLVIEQDGHHTFRDWERAFIPSLRWALPGTDGRLQGSSPAVAVLEAVPAPRSPCPSAGAAVRRRGTCPAAVPSASTTVPARRRPDPPATPTPGITRPPDKTPSPRPTAGSSAPP